MYSKTHKHRVISPILILVLVTVIFLNSSFSNEHAQAPPNVIIIFLDDSGWSDFQPFSDNAIHSPNVQELAQEGIVFKNFYVPQAICSASRAALLTGCYPGRTKVFSACLPRDRGLETNFPTMGEVFKESGYTTAIFGKWHIGNEPDTRPHMRGFDESCGLMYSNDMWKYHPTHPEFWGKDPLQFWENGKVIIDDVSPDDQKNLTKWYTEHAVDFISRNHKDPFFLYVPHSMPHVPIYCSEGFEGKSGAGLYGDVILELDWSVGEMTKALKEQGLENNTIIIFTSDNGPWINYGNHAGTTPFREAKGTSFDGGTRSACIISYPGHIDAGGISEKAFCTIDLLPTICHLTGVPLPDSEIDGKNVWDLISNMPGAENPQEYYAFTIGNQLEAILSGDGKWKLHLPHKYRSLETVANDGAPGKYKQLNIDLALFNMENDPLESTDVKDQYPEIVKQLKEFAEIHSNKFY